MQVHLKWFMGTLVLVHYIVETFYFLFSFLRMHKKHKNANKRITYFFPIRCFLSAFFIFVCLFVFCTFVWLCFCALCAFWGFLMLFGAFGAFCAYKIFL